MSPALIELALQILLKFGPTVYNQIIEAAHKEKPVAADWRIAAATPLLDQFLTETNTSLPITVSGAPILVPNILSNP